MSFIKSTSTITDIAITVPNLSGGTNGRVVRINGSNSVTNASYTDTVAQLNTILIKQGDVYYASGVVSGFSGLLVGSAYFLSNDGNITENAPTPTSTIKALYLGFAINETDLVFRPGIPIAGN
jgi:hypothetical protein